ncbi:uncharacterized protein FIBRA_05098 [Fibroporia radiculosa]|uniref:Uncharacterized protein n=1 Tax=Fibroporia radiculosa TaxID=599839 RepID=J4G8J0_9APHY|nr:uncharacterized protein FIBRA_05098 [Fibroporia radiculosa]CCM02983.1 predicted protein [Fibroporia radiculosa]
MDTIRIPVIMVTPATPSRDSLPTPMRVALREEVPFDGLEEHLEEYEGAEGGFQSVAGDIESILDGYMADGEEEDNHTHSASQDVNYTRLTLNLGNASVASMEDLVATLSVIGREDDDDRSWLSLEAESRSSGDVDVSSMQSAFIVVDAPRRLVRPKDRRQGEAHAADACRECSFGTDVPVVRRRPRPAQRSRRYNPTWRHAMYVSAEFWPAQTDLFEPFEEKKRTPMRRLIVQGALVVKTRARKLSHRTV